MARETENRRWRDYFSLTTACIILFLWITIYRNFIPTEHLTLAPSRITHGFGVPRLRENEAVENWLQPVPTIKNYTKFVLEYGKYGEGIINQTECLKEILIYGSINNMIYYPELEAILNLFRENVGFSNTAHVKCSDNCAIGIRVGMDEEHFENKDVILLGMFPKNMIGQFELINSMQHRQGQTWIYYSTEPPYRVLRWVKDMELQNIQYHKLMTYHMDSDIPIPFGSYVLNNITSKVDKVLPNYAQNKTGLIAWMASNCEEIFWARSELVENLMVYFHIDVYGRCGSLSCKPRDSEHCDWLMSKYKFYLTLANSECHHYITEKFWKTALQHNIVPVVYGAPKVDLDHFAPPNSYIHVADFASVEELANYLLLVDKNDTMYNSFFKWKTNGYIQTLFPPKPNFFCDIFSRLNSYHETRTKMKTLGESVWWKTCRYDVTMTSAVYTRHQKLAVQYKKWKPWNTSDPG